MKHFSGYLELYIDTANEHFIYTFNYFTKEACEGLRDEFLCSDTLGCKKKKYIKKYIWL